MIVVSQTQHESINRYNLAVDLSLAALTGDGVFNFGEVLATPLLAVLQSTPHAWLSELLQARLWVCVISADVRPRCTPTPLPSHHNPPTRQTYIQHTHIYVYVHIYIIPQQVFDHGDVDAFAALVDRHRDAYFAQPALASRQEFVKVRFFLCGWWWRCGEPFGRAKVGSRAADSAPHRARGPVTADAD